MRGWKANSGKYISTAAEEHGYKLAHETSVQLSTVFQSCLEDVFYHKGTFVVLGGKIERKHRVCK